MSNLIPTKIITDEGVIAIKNGIKPNKRNLVPVERKPAWLRGNIKTSPNYKQLKKIVHQRKLNTVCEEAMCPNISECWNHGTATFMLLGSVCTRACKFCAVDKVSAALGVVSILMIVVFGQMGLSHQVKTRCYGQCVKI